MLLVVRSPGSTLRRQGGAMVGRPIPPSGVFRQVVRTPPNAARPTASVNVFSETMVDALASWRDFHDSFYHLWLDSGEFEDWAAAQLRDPSSPVNTRGLDLARRLSIYHRCYLWWFQDEGAPDWIPPTRCPRCSARWNQVPWGATARTAFRRRCLQPTKLSTWRSPKGRWR